MKFVVAFSGKALSGKSTSQKIVQNLCRVSAVACFPASFGAGIKYLAATLFGWDGEKELFRLADGTIDYGRGRGLLISVGQKMREIDPDVWVNHTIRSIEAGPPGVYVVDDVRMQNELMRLKEAFGKDFICLRLTREGGEAVEDPTETDLDGFKGWDAEIKNTGSIDDLTTAVATSLKGYADAVNKKQD